MTLGLITSERRRAERRACHILAVAFPGQIPCVLVDISDTGARVQCPEGTVLPDCPIIVEWQSGRAHDAAIAWHHEEEAGLCFLRSCSLEDRVPVVFAEAQIAWRAGRDKALIEVLLGGEDRADG